MHVSFSCYLFPVIEHHQVLILRSIHIILRNPRVLKKMERLLFIIEMENLKAWVILLKELPIGPLFFTTVTVMNYIEDFLLMANHQENGCLQIQQIMKKQSNLIKINFFTFRYNNFLYHYHSIPFHFIALKKFKK